jgi:hypothetical protein
VCCKVAVAEDAAGVGARHVLGHVAGRPHGSLLPSGALPPVLVPAVPAQSFDVPEAVAVKPGEQFGVCPIGQFVREQADGGRDGTAGGFGSRLRRQQWLPVGQVEVETLLLVDLLSCGHGVEAGRFGAAHERPLG